MAKKNLKKHQKQKERLKANDLVFVDYAVCVEKVLNWCDTKGTVRDADMFMLGTKFALAMTCSNYIKHGIDISNDEANGLEECMRTIEKYGITDVFMDVDNIDYMFLEEYNIWNNIIN